MALELGYSCSPALPDEGPPGETVNSSDRQKNFPNDAPGVPTSPNHCCSILGAGLPFLLPLLVAKLLLGLP